MANNGKFVKGQVANPKGRGKGTLNKDKAKFIESLQELFDSYSGDMKEWLLQIEDPEKRFQVLKDFAEYIYPKLSRTEGTFNVNMKDAERLKILENAKEPS